jgi:hypothetical protein
MGSPESVLDRRGTDPSERRIGRFTYSIGPNGPSPLIGHGQEIALSALLEPLLL